MATRKCEVCAKEMVGPAWLMRKKKYCSQLCNGNSKSIKNGVSIGQYEGKSIFLSAEGYPCIYRSGRSKHLHVYIVEKVLGKELLKGAIVHHIDGDKMNWANSNLLVLQNIREHIQLHHRQKLVNAGGIVGKHYICNTCKAVKVTSEFNKGGKQWNSHRCKDCSTKANFKWYDSKRQEINAKKNKKYHAANPDALYRFKKVSR